MLNGLTGNGLMLPAPATKAVLTKKCLQVAHRIGCRGNPRLTSGHPSRDARLSIGLIGLSLLALVAYLWLGLGTLKPRTLEGQRIRRPKTPLVCSTELTLGTEAAGLSGFHHDTEGVRTILDVVAPGLALLDLDADADLDLVLLAGPGHPKGIAVFLNQIAEQQRLLFVDATEQVGIDWSGAAQGICAGDYDRDGDVDLFVTAIGRNLLLQNRRVEDKALKFIDVTEQAGVAGFAFARGPGIDGRIEITPVDLLSEEPDALPQFSTGASFGDFDLDGDLDLFVANYVAFSPTDPGLTAGAERDDPVEYQPGSFPAEHDYLYRYDADAGRFEEKHLDLGLRDVQGKSLAGLIADIDHHQFVEPEQLGFPEIIVANDASQIVVYHHVLDRASKRRYFVNQAQALQLADVHSCRGVARGDADGDGDLDILFTHFHEPPSLLLLNWERVGEFPTKVRTFFRDASSESGLSQPFERLVGWGAVFFDYDNDGDEDLLVGNGGASPFEGTAAGCAPQKLVLLQNSGGRFQDVSASAGELFSDLYNARGVVAGDLDLDGDLDAVVTQNNGPVLLLLNQLEKPQHLSVASVFPFEQARKDEVWLRGDLIGISWRVEYAGRTLLHEFSSGGSYLSQGPFQTLKGLGTRNAADSIEFVFPHPLKSPLRQIFVPEMRSHSARKGQ